jgi:hypothetical protein
MTVTVEEATPQVNYTWKPQQLDTFRIALVFTVSLPKIEDYKYRISAGWYYDDDEHVEGIEDFTLCCAGGVWGALGLSQDCTCNVNFAGNQIVIDLVRINLPAHFQFNNEAPTVDVFHREAYVPVLDSQIVGNAKRLILNLILMEEEAFDNQRKLAYDVTVHFWQYEPFNPPRTVPNTDVWRVSYAMGNWAVTQCRDIFVPDGTAVVDGNVISLGMLTINNNVTFRDEEPTLEVIDLTDEPGPDPDDPNEPHPDWPPNTSPSAARTLERVFG